MSTSKQKPSALGAKQSCVLSCSGWVGADQSEGRGDFRRRERTGSSGGDFRQEVECKVGGIRLEVPGRPPCVSMWAAGQTTRLGGVPESDCAE